jgi:hypothetical protein
LLTKYLLDNCFQKGHANKTLFIRETSKEIIIIQIYVDDIVFSATCDSLSYKFVNKIKSEFEMSMIGELKFILAYKLSNLIMKFLFLNQSMHEIWLKSLVSKVRVMLERL